MKSTTRFSFISLLASGALLLGSAACTDTPTEGADGGIDWPGLPWAGSGGSEAGAGGSTPPEAGSGGGGGAAGSDDADAGLEDVPGDTEETEEAPALTR